MKYGIKSALTILAALLATSALSAHHYSAALFDMAKKVELTGTLTAVDWRNPHIYFTVEVKGNGAQPEAWQIETQAPSYFKNRSVGRPDFEKAMGHTVVLELAPAKDGSLHGLLAKITFPDGNSMTFNNQQQRPQAGANAAP